VCVHLEILSAALSTWVALAGAKEERERECATFSVLLQHDRFAHFCCFRFFPSSLSLIVVPVTVCCAVRALFFFLLYFCAEIQIKWGGECKRVAETCERAGKCHKVLIKHASVPLAYFNSMENLFIHTQVKTAILCVAKKATSEKEVILVCFR
jgi:hypothetical protein